MVEEAKTGAGQNGNAAEEEKKHDEQVLESSKYNIFWQEALYPDIQESIILANQMSLFLIIKRGSHL